MKKIVLLLLVFCLTDVLLIHERVVTAERVVIIDEPINVRSGPGVNNTIIGQVYMDDEYEKVTQKGNWIKIRYNGEAGWIHANYVTTVEAASSFNETAFVRVNGLNIRSKPTTSASILGQLNKGTKVQTITEQNNWVKISFQQKEGWIAKEYLQHNSGEPATAQQATKKGTITVQTPILNVRSEANMQSNTLAQVNQGDSFSYYQQVNGWYEIELPNGVKGWVANWLVSTQHASQQINGLITLLHDGTNIRQGPSTNSSIVGTGAQGEQYEVVHQENGWYEIEYNGATAYVADWIVTQDQNVYNEQASRQVGLQNKTIVIDPGHGGRDVGTTSTSGMYEKYLTLETAQRLEDKLELAGANVFLTRDDDSYITLSSRALLANIRSADAFLSLHYNSFPQSPDANGIGTFYYNEQHKAFAETMQRAMIEATGLNDRQTKRGDFHVIRENQQQALLLELGFLSNEKEAYYVQTNEYQEKIIRGITAGLIQHFSY
ncbi:SH3 domain-containing protein [Pontibacillus litoralis]|nr:SH3 domain-containing protein [Pontibacillus litoralis]